MQCLVGNLTLGLKVNGKVQLYLRENTKKSHRNAIMLTLFWS